MTKRSEVILGIGGFSADASACLLVDGKVTGAIQEERLTRNKHQGGWPHYAIDALLQDAGIKKTDITDIAFSYDPWIRIRKRLPYRLLKLFRYPLVSIVIIVRELIAVAEFTTRLRRLKREAGAQIHYVRHHIGHVSSAYFTSGFSGSAFYSADARGEWESCLWGTIEHSKFNILGNVTYPDSLGFFYSGLTHFLGFEPYSDEYKVMGLAAYGNPRFAAEMRKVVQMKKDGTFSINRKYIQYQNHRNIMSQEYFTQAFFDCFGERRQKSEEITQHHKDLAASGQMVFEEIVLQQLNRLHAETKSQKLCLAGGCAMNGVMVGKIYSKTPFSKVHLSSASGDDGLALGVALYTHHVLLNNPKTAAIRRANLGSSYNNEQICNYLDQSKLTYQQFDDVVPEVVRFLKDQKIIGWFQGEMEYGARALGYRSILADPTSSEMKDLINRTIKFREGFRPFAPSVVEEEASKYFHLQESIPFMTTVCSVTEHGRQHLPAVTHVDGTARVHTVSERDNPLFWRLIKTFGEETGTPVILNTSFNIMGEPIVENPLQAIRCFFSSGLDVLILGNCIVRK